MIRGIKNHRGRKFLKCIGCKQLIMVSMERADRTKVYYDCLDHFLPYMTSIGGLLLPAWGTQKAAAACPEDITTHCILCESTATGRYGDELVWVCPVHDKAWGKWLDAHPERRGYLAPKGRARRSNWIEVSGSSLRPAWEVSAPFISVSMPGCRTAGYTAPRGSVSIPQLRTGVWISGTLSAGAPRAAAMPAM